MKTFGDYAKYYDLLYRDKDYTGEVEYIDRLIKKYANNAKSILDLGCGTGKHALALSKKGYVVTGIDISRKMLDSAKILLKNSEKKDVNFILGDIRTIRLNKIYDVVTSLFHVVSYLTTNSDIVKALETVNFHLKKNGIFIFDCWYGPAVLTDMPKKKTKKFEDDSVIIKRLSVPKLYPNDNLVDVNYTVFIRYKHKKGKHIQRLIETHRMRYLFKPEIEYFLLKTGFKLIYSKAWLTGKNLGLNSWGACFIARKT